MRPNLAEARTNVVTSDFRETRWGMSRSEVKLVESRYPLSENETHITYKDQFLELDATVGFHFVNDSLIEAGYAFNEISLDLKSCISKYQEVRLNLSNCYGLPIIDKEMSVSSEDDSCCMQLSPTADNMIFITEWKTPRSIVRLLLVSGELSTEFGILHISRESEINLNISIN